MTSKKNASQGVMPRFLKVWLAIVLVVSLVPVSAFAVGEEGQSSDPAEQVLGAEEVTENEEADKGAEDLEVKIPETNEVIVDGEEPKTEGEEDAALGDASPLATAPGTLNATIIDDDGVPIDLGGLADSAKMSYQNATNHTVGYYYLTVNLSDLDPNAENTLEVTLPRGMEFQYTNINTFLANLSGQFAGHVASATYSNTGAVAGYTFPCGTYKFVLNVGVSATSVTIPVSYNAALNTDTITNAIRVTLSDDNNNVVSETLEKVTRPIDPGILVAAGAGHPHSGDYFLFTNNDTYTLEGACREINTAGSGNPYSTIVTGLTVTVKITDKDSTSGVRASLTNTDTTGAWTMVPGANEGEYVFTYTPSGGYRYVNGLVVPYSIVFEDSPAEAWVQNDRVLVTYVASGTYFSYAQFAEGNPTGNIGSSVSSVAATRYLTKDVSHDFRYQEPKEKVFVNYGSNTEYLAKDSNPSAGSMSYSSDIDRADPDPLKNDETGVLGIFYMGNAGTSESAPKTIEMHFDSTNYGVMALYAPLPKGITITQIHYTTNNNSNWTTATSTWAADTYGRIYISYYDLGINNRAEFITGLKYECGSIPADTFYTVMPGSSSNDLSFYGKWLGENNSTANATATIEVYDTDDSSSVTTGAGKVTTKRIDDRHVGTPSVPSVSVTAGQVMKFALPISTGTNFAQGNATTEHPVFYIRSEIVDETGAPVPITNINLSNRGRLSGEIDQDKLDISYWMVDVDGNETSSAADAVAYIYKVDTKNVPTSQACIVSRYIDDKGVLTTGWHTLSYQIATTSLTPSQSYNSRDMVYVFDPDAVHFMGGSSSRQITASSEPAIYKSINHGEDWSKGVLNARSTQSVDTYRVNSVQSILATSQIKHVTGTSWTNYTAGSDPIPVGVSSGSGFQLKTNVINNAGTPVTGTEVYVPIPKAGEDWGALSSSTELSLILKNAAVATVLDEDNDPSTGNIAGFTVKYGIGVIPSESGSVLQGYTWKEASDLSAVDWANVNCIQIIVNGIDDLANLEVILDVKADENQVGLIEGLTDIWHPIFYRDFTNADGQRFQDWATGSEFGVQSALSGIKGLLFEDGDVDGIYDLSKGDSALDGTSGTGWKVRVYLSSDPANALQEKSIRSNGTYEFYDLVSSGGETYIIEAVNGDSASYMFTRTATRAANNATGDYGPYGANTFVSGDGGLTARASAVADEIDPGQSSPYDIDVASTYNIGVTAKAKTTLTWRSADTSKGTVDGTLKTLSEYPSTAMTIAAAPAVTAATGYTFAGWARVETGEAAPAWDATPWKAADAILNNDFGAGNGTYGYDSYDYYAVFTHNSFDVTYSYHDNGGANPIPTGVPSLTGYNETSVGYGVMKSVAAKPTMVGYTLSDWVATGITPAADGSYSMPNNNVSFTAYWTLNSYDITYSYSNTAPTGAPVAASYNETAVGYGASKTVAITPSSGVSASVGGYTFSGWTPSGVAVSAGSFTMPDNAVSFSGSWAANMYSITYENLQGATNPNAGKTSYQTGEAAISLAEAGSRTGYSFGGWNISLGSTTPDITHLSVLGNGTKGAVINSGTYGNLVATAIWIPDSYTVSYHANTGTGVAPANQSVAYNDNWTTASNTFTKTGYNFAGWNTAADGTGMSYQEGQASLCTFTQNITLYAQWDPAAGVAYRIEHYLIGTDGIPALNFTEDRTGISEQTATASPRVYSGYTHNASHPATVSSAAISPDGSTVLRLYYSINYYTVTFLDWNGATLALRSVPYGSNAIAPSNPYRIGHAFSGWDRGYTNVTSNIVVNATYVPLTFTIVFVDYDGRTIQSSTVNYGQSVTPPANPTRSGFRFTGWDKDSSAWTNVTADATIRAMFDDQTVQTPPTTITETREDRTPPPPASSASEELAAAAAEIGIPSIGVPLAAPPGYAAWALMNLILAVLGVVMALVFAILRSLRKSDEQDDNQEREQRQQRKSAASPGFSDQNETATEETEDTLRKRRGIGWLVVTILLAVAGAVLFFLTEDISLPMVWVDIWTIVQAIIFVALLIIGNIAIRRKKIKPEEEGEDGQQNTAATASA